MVDRFQQFIYTYIHNFTKMPPVGAKIFHSDEYADGANRTKLAIAFHDSFAKAPKSGGFINQLFTYLLTYLLTYSKEQSFLRS